MGNIYFYGYERERDYEQALVWYRLAALQENAQAQQKLGIAYPEAWASSRTPPSRPSGFRAAAVQGDAFSQYRLAELYEEGHGVQRDLDEAERRYQLAAEGGHGPTFEARRPLRFAFAEGD